MDSTEPLPPPITTATSSNDKITKLASTSKRALFFATYRRNQPWSIPSKFMYQMAKNPSSSKVYQKLIKTCKYFFIINPILLIQHLNLIYNDNKWNATVDEYCERVIIDLKTITAKIWIQGGISTQKYSNDADDQYLTTTVLPKIFRCDITWINIEKENIAYHDFLFIASKCDAVYLFNVTVKSDEDGSVVSIEKLFEALPNVICLWYDIRYAASNIITQKSVTELIKLPHFLTLTVLQLYGLSDTFDIDGFYDYIKKNKQTTIHLIFCEQTSDAYKQRLQAIVNEIVEAENHEYKVASIQFPDHDESTYQKLMKLI